MTIPTALLAIALSPFAAGQTAWDSEAETHWLMSLVRSDKVRDRVIRFAPELRRLGFEGVDGQIAATARRIQAAHLFQDVPLNHWASDALRDLKAIGVLRGYPGGVFDQPNPNQRNAEVRPGR